MHLGCVDAIAGTDDIASHTRTFESFVDARWSRLVRSAVLLGADVHTAEDLVQTALARCFFKWDKVARAEDLDAYVHRVLINTLKAWRRRRWTGEVPSVAVPDPGIPDDTPRIDQHRALLAALGRLPHGQREAVVLRYYADFTEARTADALGIAVGTVKSRCARALAALAADPSLQNEEDR